MRTIPATLFVLLLILGCSDSPPQDALPQNQSTQGGQALRPSSPSRSSPSPSRNSRPPASVPLESQSARRFQRLTSAETGIDFAIYVDPDHENRRLYHSAFMCGGVAIGDVDSDGRPDLYLVRGDGRNRLYRNVGEKNLRFEDITELSGVGGGDHWGAGATMFDIDNDGDLDIYLCNYNAPNHLYINDGTGKFHESARTWNLAIRDASLSALPNDYDGDGDLDLYLVTNRLYRKGGRPRKPPVEIDSNGKPFVKKGFDQFYTLREKSPGKHGLDEYGRPDLLLRNNGDGTFSDVTTAAGIAGHGYGLTATSWDYDGDGWLDIYVNNDFNDPDYLYHNNGDGTFTNRLLDAFPHTPWFSMGSTAGDVNNDGLMDLLAVDMAATNHFKQKTTMGTMNATRLAAVSGPPPQLMRNALLINAGTGRFLEAAYLSGLANTDWSWSVRFADLDNDGWEDVFVTNGTIRSFNDSDVPYNESLLIGRTDWDLFQQTPPRPEQNLAFRNLGDLQFSDASHTWGLDHVGMSYGSVFGDLDRDGDLDAIVVNVDEPVSIYQNNTTNGERQQAMSHYLSLRFLGSVSNRFGIGSVVRIRTSAGSQMRLLNSGSGFMACGEALVHFGLGDVATVEVVEVTWPSGRRQVLRDVAANQLIELRESDAAETPSILDPSRPAPMYELVKETVATGRREEAFDDFARQPLLPNRLSRLGPGVAWGQIGDERGPTAFMGGAAGSPSLLLSLKDRKPTAVPLEEEVGHEDMGALFLDCDADGDQDLYVVSGGIEAEPGDEVLRDRLYRNDGSGRFTRDVDALPNVTDSGGPVCAADFDRDGDLDLFVGGRSVPGQYPLAPKSRLFVNDSGRYADATAELAPALLATGMVTAGVWTDIDNDGWIDLVVAHEWGPVKTFINVDGHLVDRTLHSGIAKLTGWWNGVDAIDVDGDGDIDLIATNFGLNTKYHASMQHPALLYYGDFDQSGTMRIVEAEFENETLFPVRGRSCSTRAIPSLGSRFTNFRQFAMADLQDLYSDECIEASYRFAATTLQSTLFLNDGRGHYLAKPLPRIAQVSPGFGVQFTEVNGDAHPDIYLVQNFYSPQPETGPMDGGLSQLLLGTGDGTFLAVGPQASGLIVPQDATSLTVVDVNSDGRLDFVVASNEGPRSEGGGVQAFVASSQFASNLRTVTLTGPAGNPTAIGARVTISLSDGSNQTDEVRAGSGYLSQSTPTLVFGCPSTTEVSKITVRWPNGSVSAHVGVRGQRHYPIARPLVDP